MKRIIVGIGEVLWDVFPAYRTLGGAVANFAYHFSQLGHQGLVVSAIGEDESGAEIRNELRSKKIKHLLTEVPYPTGKVLVSLDRAGEPDYEILAPVAWDHLPYSSELEWTARTCSGVCFGTLAQRGTVSRNTVCQFLRAMNKEALRVFDVNLRQNYYTTAIIEDSLRSCNVLKINDSELRVLGELFGFESADIEAACRTLLQRYDLRMVILTAGSVESLVLSACGACSRLPTPHVDVVDTVGAGDSFTAAFCAATLQGHCIEDAHRLAVEVAAYVCSVEGGMPMLPSAIIDCFNAPGS